MEWFHPKNENTPFGQNYYEEFRLSEERTIQEVSSLEKIIQDDFNNKPAVLDLGGGFGRIGRHLLDGGLIKSLVDFDLNRNFLQVARKVGIKNVVNGDMRHLPFAPESFDLILVMFSSFGYFTTKREDKQTAAESYRVLRDSGQFVLDLPNFHRIIQNFIPVRELRLENGDIIKYTKRIEEDVLIEERMVTDKQGNSKILSPMRLRIYLQTDIQQICHSAGFRKTELTDEGVNVFNPETSKRLWVRCFK
jgi:SAM-dependent methyltransferase